MRITVDLKSAKRGLRALPDAVVRNVDRKLERGAAEVAREAKVRAPKAFSNLTNSIMSDRIGVMRYRVQENVRHGHPVEFGSRPHGVDSTKLIPWVELVTGARGKEARDKAFLIARSIAMRGTKAQPYMGPTADVMGGRVNELALEGVRDGVREAFA
ncbi:MAG TPA: HK97 gp10 family phage protein [Sideroxyarcus sp.]|nr:HK97 gp10 family phage protein [Sideroxyarcus sp.]